LSIAYIAAMDHSNYNDVHDHGHAHVPKDFGSIFALATALNVGLVAIEAVYGIAAHSVALLADAGHNLGRTASNSSRRTVGAREYGYESGTRKKLRLVEHLGQMRSFEP
jgi:predicted DNA repair protein MutK